jgi:transposase InsO family protein
MRHKMSKDGRRELLMVVRKDYRDADWKEKRTILDNFVRSTGYNRKYAVTLLGTPARKLFRKKPERVRVYEGEVVEVLKEVWLLSNRLCSKRLKPFLEVFLGALERHGHLSVTPSTREKLLAMSPATMDRRLKEVRKAYGRSKSTTKPGGLLRSQIPVRTFADWSNVEPGFLEADCVAHCGSVAKGIYLNTLTLTDIATGWTECLALARKTESAVATALSEAVHLLPFAIKGFDSDNGSEFINYEVVGWCVDREVTFTSSRAYKKNDQAHVEEKNGSIVRRYVGYDRYEGEQSLEQMKALYRQVRLFVNYFQPSMKLLSKQRVGGRITKRYEPAKTPCQRVLETNLPAKTKRRVEKEFLDLDPVRLLQEIEKLQVALWKGAAVPEPAKVAVSSLMKVLEDTTVEAEPALASMLERHRQELMKRQRKPKLVDSQRPVKPDSTAIQAVLRHAAKLGCGRQFTIKEVLHLGLRSTVQNALCRLVEANQIVRTGHGKYCLQMNAKQTTKNRPKIAVNQ